MPSCPLKLNCQASFMWTYIAGFHFCIYLIELSCLMRVQRTMSVLVHVIRPLVPFIVVTGSILCSVVPCPWQRFVHINYKEVCTIIQALSRWVPLWHGEKFMVHTDSIVTKCIINKGHSRNPYTASCGKWPGSVLR